MTCDKYYHMQGIVKASLPIFLVAVIVISGCASDISPRDIAKAHPVVKQFLEEHPNAEIMLTYFSENQSVNIIDEVRGDCNNPYIEPKNLYKVTVIDDVDELSVLAWLDWEEKIVLCAIIESTNPCKDVTCQNSEKTCPDGYKATCPNTCSEGTCSSCDPDCTGHEEIDKCKDVSCTKTMKTCPDGTEVSCQNTCNPDTGQCSSCEPDCTGHTDLCAGKSCDDDNLCTTDSCVNGECKHENKEDGTDCGDNKECDSGVCKCVSHSSHSCYLGHIYWYDSCETLEEKKESCDDGCLNNTCISKSVIQCTGNTICLIKSGEKAIVDVDGVNHTVEPVEIYNQNKVLIKVDDDSKRIETTGHGIYNEVHSISGLSLFVQSVFYFGGPSPMNSVRVILASDQSDLPVCDIDESCVIEEGKSVYIKGIAYEIEVDVTSDTSAFLTENEMGGFKTISPGESYGISGMNVSVDSISTTPDSVTLRVSVPSPPGCLDYDGGFDYYNKTSTGKIEPGNPEGGMWAVQTDVCSDSSTVQEFSCFGDVVLGTHYKCPNGCEDGACLPSECLDLDGGLDYYIKTSTGKIDSDYPDSGMYAVLTDECAVDSTTVGGSLPVDPSWLIEYSCEGSAVLGTYYTCPKGCENGVCIV
jgi:hypothetical protein